MEVLFKIVVEKGVKNERYYFNLKKTPKLIQILAEDWVYDTLSFVKVRSDTNKFVQIYKINDVVKHV